MTAQRRSWTLRSAVVTAMAAGLLAGLAAPAYADHDVRLANIGNVTVQAGGSGQNVQLRVENRGQNNHTSEDGVARNVTLTMTVPGGIGAYIASTPNGCGLSNNETRMDCTIAEIGPGQAFSGVVQVAAHGNAPIPAGENRNETASVALTSHGGSTQQFNVRVNGPDRPPAVPEVTGRVTDQSTGQPIEGARVTLIDSQGGEFTANTDAQGEFRIAADNIAEGQLALRASKDGFNSTDPSTHTGVAGQPLSGIQLVLISTATPSPTPEDSPPPTSAPPETATPAPAIEPASGGGFFTTLLIVLGLLFVALGIGAIVLLIIRQRRRAREEEEDDGLDGAGDPTPGPPGPGPRPGSRGAYRPTPTQVAGAGAAQTQVIGPGGALPAVGPSPALANAPTMMQRGAAGAADQTAMIPRAEDPGGPRTPGRGGPTSPPAPRPAAPQTAVYGAAGSPADGPPTRPYNGYDGQRGGYEAQRGRDRGVDRGDQYGSEYGGEYGDRGADRGGQYGGQRGGGYESERGRDHGGDRGEQYGDRSGYDQPTGRYERGSYDQPDPAYRSDSYGPDPYTQPRPSSGGGYGDSGTRQYPPAPASPSPQRSGHTGGYDDRYGGYENQGYENQGYENQGYENRGYENQGYDAGRDYGPAPEPRGHGADPYDEPRSRPRHPDSPPERRRLDWLDD